MKRTFPFLLLIALPLVSFGQNNLFEMSLIYHEPEMDSIEIMEENYNDSLKAYIFKLE